MKKTLIAIALYMGHRIGYWDKASSIGEKADTNFAGLIEKITPYVTIAHDIVEAGHDIAMAYPENVMVAVHTEFADDWARFIRSECRFPTSTETMVLMKNVMRNAFSNIMTNTQEELFAKKLDQFEGPDDD